MKLIKRLVIAIAAFAVITPVAWSLPPIMDLVEKQDELQKVKSDITAKVTFTQEKANQGKKVYESLYYRRDKDDAFLIVVLSPDSDKGNGYLRVGDNFWMYLFNTRTFQHVSRDESISGTDAKGGDFETRKMTELYKPALDANGKEKISEEAISGIPVYKFEIAAKVDDVTYPKEIFWVRKDNSLPMKVESYSLSDTLMQSSYFLKYTKTDNKFIPVKQMFRDEFEKGNNTILEITGITFEKLDDSIFTKAYLENLSK